MVKNCVALNNKHLMALTGWMQMQKNHQTTIFIILVFAFNELNVEDINQFFCFV